MLGFTIVILDIIDIISTGARACDSGADCLDNECCARNMFAPRSFCSPMRARKETCDATPYLLDSAREVSNPAIN